MNSWSNIEISHNDPEIIKINDFENSLSELSENVKKIRELITRFEVCHFKYRVHLKKIMDSIAELNTNVDTNNIGSRHIQHGENAISTDTTGRSIIGQQYVWAIKEWLNDNDTNVSSAKYDRRFGQKIQNWLGDKNPEKLRLVRLLLARLTWDWASMSKLQNGNKFKAIEQQVNRLDICHYAFPNNLDFFLKNIGQMEAVEEKDFKGCGSFNAEIKNYLEKIFLDLNNSLKAFHANKKLSKNELIKKWLTLCLAKTIKENIKLSIPIYGIDN